ncbi:TPA: cytochrome b [Klebsiella pneumoniae subsp. ozaenae]|nr:Uncharacterized secreted protein [Klebsiella pneumoniae]STT63420.1 Uncharacterized secreted protein [Klebsiella pneumoniae]HBY9727791.1 cytochrome b [Klebsiella pneumoniae]HBY9818935.1 cytochrome b [Klebsiella pneumoniae]HBZ0070497.1 cytochrome b [Klebsiella pneumoniae subsp. ozaenae]
MQPLSSESVHPLWLRSCHWVNDLAITGMLLSGWRIYNASPLFSYTFPVQFTLGGWLGGALQWHFALMWVLMINGAVYISLGVVTGRFRHKFFPLSWRQLKESLPRVLRGKLQHTDLRQYNMVQKIAYLLIILDGVGLVLSGMVLWKSVQFPFLYGYRAASADTAGSYVG